ncbi:uncharacterized protein [Physcomitrium patens]|uniref:Suppressor of white apricot N-terminal domain-containing protein n=1 Tax=Physcomitrium patens TaxID=3218 RepID=A9RVP2_PHYPA|nr:CLK4-associating serine/arginine rich protein-like [Physcomitrium patens]PNR45532.1 hypothetical protein PHYPA_015303 [Physcomitrium patens]|eukprot:XP_024388950.1 CLK4-associating serine/arginine rich protein-like [Physcomitrella patens]
MWHEARRSEKKVHEIMDAARRRAQKRAIFLAKRRVDPQQTLRIVGTRCRLHHDATIYQATEDQQGLIPWNGKEDNLIDRFDGRALLDVIREYNSSAFQHLQREKTEEEDELEVMVNFQRYRDLIKQRRRGLSDKQGLDDVEQELEARSTALIGGDKQRPMAAAKPTYGQVGFAYEGSGGPGAGALKEEALLAGIGESDSDEEAAEEEEGSSSEDSEDELIESIGQDYGVQRFNSLLSLDRKLKEEEGRQKELVKGDPTMRKLSRKERRKVSQQEREREKQAVRQLSNRPLQHDPYRELRKSPTYDSYQSYQRRDRGRSSSHSPLNSRSRLEHRYHDSDSYGRDHHRRKRKNSCGTTSTIEYITEFGVEGTASEPVRNMATPVSPPLHDLDAPRHTLPSRRILEALHSDPAAIAVTPSVSGLSATDWDARQREREWKASGVCSSSALSKLSKVATPGSATQKTSQSNEKSQETPQERLKRIMNKQLSKQIKKDIVSEAGKRREQERERQEKLAETRRIAQRSRRGRSRSRSLSPVRYRYRSRSRSRSPIRSYPRSSSGRSRSRSYVRS